MKQRLMKLPEYRALLAIEQPMAEVADIPELTDQLQTAKQKIVERLMATQEYQALLTVEKAIKDISAVLEVVADDGNYDAVPASVEEVLGAKELSEIAPAPAAAPQQPVSAVAVAAPLAGARPAIVSETAVVTEWPATKPVEEHPERPVANPAERLSTVGLVEEWRLTTMVRESFSANEAKDDVHAAGDGKAEPEKAKVA
ncbi:MAG TPA: hypothetical protein VMA30_03860 [Xanthobacteraceae bacterium]|nr:hypothetical protein [Xanthobacteraceae bacterium]